MELKIRNMTAADRDAVLEMMRTFYASDAVWSNGSEEIFQTDVSLCIEGSPYLEGYVFENSAGIAGYAMVAKSFSTEFGKPCIWIEDLYIRAPHRGTGIGSCFLRSLEEKYPDAIFRLEVEEENQRAIKVYRGCGFDILPYMEMKKLRN